MYNSQVNNGGHYQYYDNGYAGTNSKNIDIHDDFVNLFKELDMIDILPSGKKVFDIIKKFELDLEDEIETCNYCGGSGVEDCRSCSGDGELYCTECDGEGEIDDESCSNCSGSGRITCEDCEGSGQTPCDNCDGYGESDTGVEEPNTSMWNKLDDEWYEIDDDIRKEFDDYLKSLTLDGEIISNLVEIAKEYQKYNL